MSVQPGRQLPVFPTDDFTLDQLEHAIDTCRGESNELVGGEFTLNQFLDFMSGHDPERQTLIGHTGGDFGDDAIPVYEAWDAHYTERCVIRSLIAEVRRFRAGATLSAQEK